MTLIGKICTVLIFIMSLVFMSLSLMVYATHQNWKLAVMNPNAGENNYPERGLKPQIEDAERTIAGLREEKETITGQLERERATRRMAIQQLQSKLVLLQNDLDQKESELGEKIAENGQLLAELKVAQAELASKTEEVTGLRENIQTAIDARNDVFDEVVTLTSSLHDHQQLLETQKERAAQLALDITEMKRVMDHHGLTVHTPLHNKPPVPLDGIVTAISGNDENLIEISLGSDDGLRAGHELVVVRGGSYLGVIIRHVDSNKSVAEIVRDTSRGRIRKDDRVTTRFG